MNENPPVGPVMQLICIWLVVNKIDNNKDEWLLKFLRFKGSALSNNSCFHVQCARIVFSLSLSLAVSFFPPRLLSALQNFYLAKEKCAHLLFGSVSACLIAVFIVFILYAFMLLLFFFVSHTQKLYFVSIHNMCVATYSYFNLHIKCINDCAQF